jgi:hypothetical protein
MGRQVPVATRSCIETLQINPNLRGLPIARYAARSEFRIERPKFYDRATAFCHNVRMPDEHTLTLRQADQARADFALLESHLEFISGQIARVPTRAYLCRTLLLATASIWALLAALWLLR